MSSNTNKLLPQIIEHTSTILTPGAKGAASSFTNGLSSWSSYEDKVVEITVVAELGDKVVTGKVTVIMNQSCQKLAQDIQIIFKMQSLPTLAVNWKEGNHGGNVKDNKTEELNSTKLAYVLRMMKLRGGVDAIWACQDFEKMLLGS